MKRDLMILEKLEKELSLKQLQIKSLLTITQAINDNISAEGLFNMYKSFLSWEMAVHKMALYILKGESWICASQINFDHEAYPDMAEALQMYRRLYTVKEHDDPPISEFDIIIPVYHKDTSIAYALIGGIREQEDLYNKIQFITTITNIIAVAIENKRLFNETIAKEKLKREMELATGVQHLLIPDTLPKTEKYELDSIYMPHFNVGGDYFDFIPFWKGQVCSLYRRYQWKRRFCSIVDGQLSGDNSEPDTSISRPTNIRDRSESGRLANHKRRALHHLCYRRSGP